MSDNEIVEHEQGPDDFPSLDPTTTHDGEYYPWKNSFNIWFNGYKDIQHNKSIEPFNRNRNSRKLIMISREIFSTHLCRTMC
jgi:hypothetical protein